MKIAKKMILLLLVTAGLSRAADYTGKITQVITKGTNQTDAGVRGRIYLKISTAPDKWPNIAPSDIAKKEYLAIILSAMANGSELKISTTGDGEYAEVAEISLAGH